MESATGEEGPEEATLRRRIDGRKGLAIWHLRTEHSSKGSGWQSWRSRAEQRVRVQADVTSKVPGPRPHKRGRENNFTAAAKGTYFKSESTGFGSHSKESHLEE